MKSEEITFSGWQLGNDWNDIVKEVIAGCLRSAVEAQQDATKYDEWFRALQMFQSIALFRESDHNEMNKRFKEVEAILDKKECFISELELQHDPVLRKTVDDALLDLQNWLIRRAYYNNMIVPKVQDTSWQPSTMRRKT